MTKSLPRNPSLENLKKQAKSLQKACEAGDAEALSRMRIWSPQNRERPKLADCQLVLAREFGFASWPQLKVAVEAANRELTDEFVFTALLCHDDPHYDHRSFHARAKEMLRDHPSIGEASIWAAAAAGNAQAVGRFLDDDPALVNKPGIHGWVPLICACYSRAADTFDAGKMLLDRGADPNAFTMKGNVDERLNQTPRKFTALAGVFGGGSTGLANQPMHPRWHDLAELLLERGADPADEILLDIDPESSLEMLLNHGLKPDAMGSKGMSLMGRTLCIAALRGHSDQVALLLSRDARTDERLRGKTAWRWATERGYPDITRLLEHVGTPVEKLTDVEEFVSHCMAGDEPGARALLDQAPDLLKRAHRALVHQAVGTRNVKAVKLTLDLGFDPNEIDDNAAIQMSGDLAANAEMLQLLLDRGASLKVRDPWYDSTGIGWAHFFDYTELRDRLLREKEICLLDALEYGRLDRVPEILKRDPEALERPFAKELSREPKPEDWKAPLVRMVEQGKAEAVGVLLEQGADRTARHPDGRTLAEVARDGGFTEIAEMLS